MLAALMLTDELQEAEEERDTLRNDIHHSSHAFETNKQIELENAVAATINDIANRIEAIAGTIEKV
jgi:cell division protein ZapA (FtsZ GTPase activity inhibitor)